MDRKAVAFITVFIVVFGAAFGAVHFGLRYLQAVVNAAASALDLMC